MKIRELKQLLELISERDITEFELEEEGLKLRIRKASSPAANPPDAGGTELASTNANTSGSAGVGLDAGTALPAAPTPSGPAATGTGAAEDGLLYVTSPMVGTFYRQPEPSAEPFAREGDLVKEGQVLCIIEAMKLMNEIECEHQGQLVKVLVENGQPVQYGDRLFAIRGT